MLSFKSRMQRNSPLYQMSTSPKNLTAQNTVPQLKMSLRSDIIILQWVKWKMHFIHISYRTSQLSIAYLKRDQNTFGYSLAKFSNKDYFIIKCYISLIL